MKFLNLVGNLNKTLEIPVDVLEFLMHKLFVENKTSAAMQWNIWGQWYEWEAYKGRFIVDGKFCITLRKVNQNLSEIKFGKAPFRAVETIGLVYFDYATIQAPKRKVNLRNILTRNTMRVIRHLENHRVCLANEMENERVAEIRNEEALYGYEMSYRGASYIDERRAYPRLKNYVGQDYTVYDLSALDDIPF